MNSARSKFADNRFLQILLGCYTILWILLAIHPVDRGDWLLENLLVFVTIVVLLSLGSAGHSPPEMRAVSVFSVASM